MAMKMTNLYRMIEEKTASQELIIKLLERKGLFRIHQIMVQSESEGKQIVEWCND